MPLFTIDHGFHYEVVREIAEGGMGIVYEAEQLGAFGFRKRVAMKVIRAQFAGQASFVENFIGEAKLVADLIHTNIVQTYHLGEAGTKGAEQVFIAMELINGVNLDTLRDQHEAKGKRLPVDLAVFVASRVARGLAYAHAKTGTDGRSLGIVHRDVSFKNVLIAFEGDVKLTDFGIAKARGYLKQEEGEFVVGKADCMSPEQADFQETDCRSDVFSAGILLAHLLLGRNIFRGETPEASREKVLGLRIPDFRTMDERLAKETRLNEILQRALQRSPARRYQNGGELCEDLERYLYEPGFGPTNEKLGVYVRDLFGQDVPRNPDALTHHSTMVLNPPQVRIRVPVT